MHVCVCYVLQQVLQGLEGNFESGQPFLPKVLPQCRKIYLSIQDPLLHICKHPCTLSFWREAPRWAGWTWVEIPAKRSISKSLSPVPEKIRGVLNNIPDILVKVRGSGVKFRFWTPFDPTFGREKCELQSGINY